MKHIPFFHSFDPATHHLSLRGATRIPDELWEFGDTIEILDLRDCHLSVLPDQFPEFTKLRIAFFSNNPFSEVPPVLRECSQLTMVGFKSCGLKFIAENSLPSSLNWLILTDNKIQKLPNSFGALRKLRKVALAGNQISELPESMIGLQELELLRLGANDISREPPPWLFELPALAWYGDAGNPFSAKFVGVNELPIIRNEELKYHREIGSSPSSTVFLATYLPQNLDVAVKHYKGPMTSDGFVADDMTALLTAGSHDNLTSGIGRIVDHPSKAEALVLNLVDSSFTTLGLPPDFSTCTRDRFAEGTRFHERFIVTVLHDIASAMEHLHSRGISHGDLYAHNILTRSDGRSILGDFGAASLYDRSKGEIRETVEIKSFGHLIEDLLTKLDSPTADLSSLNDLRTISLQCVGSAVAHRPRFSDICSALSDMVRMLGREVNPPE